MTSGPAPRHSLHIAQLDLDLRGLPPATAQAAVRALGPALAQALATRRGTPAAATHIDAGQLHSPAGTTPQQLATLIAQRIVARASGDRS
ncbi:MAG: hypothetical protein V4795_16925 [Pseudomonadota bacterium]